MENQNILSALYCFIFGFVLFSKYCLYADAAEKPQHDRKVVCYISTWATYRGKYPFTPIHIDPTLCTHLVYTYGALNNYTQDDLISNAPYTDLPQNHGLGYYEKITSLKTRHPHLKVLLCIGGWLQGSENFSKLARSKTKRTTFATNAANFLRKHNFDGLDIFWRYPTTRGGIPEDKDNFVKLLQELKNEFQKHGYLLTVYLSEQRDLIEAGYDLPSIGKIVDWVNLYSYGYHTPWSKDFGISSPLESSDSNNLKNNINYYLENGIPNTKLVVVLATYGFGYTNTNKRFEAGALQGLYDDDIGFLSFYEICGYLLDPKSGWIETWDSDTSTPIAVKEHSKISYENVRSIQLKVKYIYEKNLTGIGISTMDTDDFLGLCSSPEQNTNENKIKYPLLKAINEEFEILYNNNKEENNEPNINITIIVHEF